MLTGLERIDDPPRLEHQAPTKAQVIYFTLPTLAELPPTHTSPLEHKFKQSPTNDEGSESCLELLIAMVVQGHTVRFQASAKEPIQQEATTPKAKPE